MKDLQQIGDEIWNFGKLYDPDHEGNLRAVRKTLNEQEAF